jgi:peptidoglycan-N-acetylglucosamine deacetylase
MVPRRYLVLHGPPESKTVCLTFDDGPHPEHTPRVLDALAQHRITATFFVVGEAAERHPELLRRIAAEGHLLANHSWSHALPEEIDAATLADEVARTSALISAHTGVAPTLFRPPHGKLTAEGLVRLWGAGQTVVLWTVDPRDYLPGSAEEVRAFLALHRYRGGDVVLLHDVHEQAARLVPLIADAVRARGLRFATPHTFNLRTESTVPHADLGHRPPVQQGAVGAASAGLDLRPDPG